MSRSKPNDTRYPDDGHDWNDEQNPSCDDGNIQEVIIELRELRCIEFNRKGPN